MTDNGNHEMISCKEALRFLSEFLDGELEDAPKAQVEAHFEVCQRCYPHLKLESSFRAALQRACGGPCAPPELKSRLMAALAEVDEG
jgi:anti-sigma factor (TIGR02949 family)